ncbi:MULTISPECIES: HEAT repeat domain-containing protein [Streptomyces]|uniref:HEAT repeat domain-containing protein n=1 Tax=Streptomyces tendae TaxID=1932 RepID=A0ABX5ZPV3_STRTE|nr:HEAT repeat domain-containing protein [Streptomyces tendae]
MTMPKVETTSSRVRAGLRHDSASVRLRSALAAGSDPDPEFVETLVERCAVEPVFHVRDMLTWALTRHPAALTVPRVVAELRSPSARARSQALHTLSKIGDRGVWPAITRPLLTDADDEVARTAWRTAALLVPEGEARELAEVLVSQLGRGGRETHLSLSRALIALGEPVAPLLREAASDPDPGVRGHALATQQLWRDPDAGFAYAVEEAKRMVSLGPERQEALDADAQEAPGTDGRGTPGAGEREAVGADGRGTPGAEAPGADGQGTPGAGGPEGSGAGRREE